MTELFHTFPPTSFRKLPHTILKMAATAWWGRADSVMHLVALVILFGNLRHEEGCKPMLVIID